jgi:hypothetical protein
LWDVEDPTFSIHSAKDGGEIVNLTCRQLFTRRKIADTHLCSRLSRPQGQSPTRRIRQIEKIQLSRRDLNPRPSDSQPTMLWRAPIIVWIALLTFSNKWKA